MWQISFGEADSYALPRIYVRQLLMRFRRVKLDYLEAQLYPVEQLDR
jgi:hypothetical protein